MMVHLLGMQREIPREQRRISRAAAQSGDVCRLRRYAIAQLFVRDADE